MDYRTIRRAYLGNQLTTEEVYDSFGPQQDNELTTETTLEDWDLIKGLQKELAATREFNQPQRISRSMVVDLIDYAYLAGRIDRISVRRLLIRDGMPSGTAEHHTNTLEQIRDHEPQRTNYLDDPYTETRFCTICGRETTKSDLSRSGRCAKCNDELKRRIIVELAKKSGPWYDRWREGMLKACYRLENQEIAERKAESDDTQPETHESLCRKITLERWRTAVESVAKIDLDKPQCDDGNCLDCDADECPYRTEPYYRPLDPDDLDFDDPTD